MPGLCLKIFTEEQSIACAILEIIEPCRGEPKHRAVAGSRNECAVSLFHQVRQRMCDTVKRRALARRLVKRESHADVRYVVVRRNGLTIDCRAGASENLKVWQKALIVKPVEAS